MTEGDADLRELYQDLILDHGKHPRNFHVIDPLIAKLSVIIRCAATSSFCFCVSVKMGAWPRLRFRAAGARSQWPRLR